MNIKTRAIVANSDMIKNYKSCRGRAEEFGKIYILRNNQPDAVLFSMSEYERLAPFIEYIDGLDEDKIKALVAMIPVENKKNLYQSGNLKIEVQ